MERYRHALVVADSLVLVAALAIAIVAAWGQDTFVDDTAGRMIVAAVTLLTWPIMLWQKQSRQRYVLGEGPEEYRRVLVASGWSICVVAATAYLTGVTAAQSFLLGLFLLGSILLLLERNVLRWWLRSQRRNGPALRSAYVVAPREQYNLITERLARTNGLFASTGFWDLDTSRDPDPADVVDAAVRSGADTIIYAPTTHANLSWPRRLGWAMEGNGLELFLSPSLDQIAEPRLSIEPVEGLPLLRVQVPTFTGPARIVKRLLDVAATVVLLAVLALPLLLVALGIRLTSPGPAIFKHTRVGADGRTFTCYKFRSMHDRADEQRAALREQHDQHDQAFKLETDDRVTGFGRWLRRFSIDELPQLVNVLRGEMSLVGPRPHPIDDVEKYDADAHRRLLAKPGMTGLWQVSGRSDLDWDVAIALDLQYVENWSLSFDLLIVLKTAKAVLTGRGAY